MTHEDALSPSSSGRAVGSGTAASPNSSPVTSETTRVCTDNDFERCRADKLAKTAAGEGTEDPLVHGLFAEQVTRTPNTVAVVCEEQTITYAELNRHADELALCLRSRGVGPDRLVGICVDRSIEMVVGLLGILKAGGAYVPLDPSYPRERLAYMLCDAAPAVILTQARFREALPVTPAEVITLDGDWGSIVVNVEKDLEGGTLRQYSSSLAYVIYTSGSTGHPKGVMIEHRNVVNLWKGLHCLYQRYAECQRIALNASINFDASVQQFVQLLSGRTIFIIPQTCRQNPSMLLRFLETNRIEGVDCTPSQLRTWIAAGLLARRNAALRTVLVGGEAIDSSLWSELSQCSRTDFFNVYGPTECTVDATVTCLNGDVGAPHIGRPMENRRVYILGPKGEPLPVGVTGELYIGGAGVGRGYLNRPGLAAERFVPDSFAGEPAARMYKTGDLGRWRSDGTLEYQGRNDQQVKIRGFRIELGEIEAHLAKHEAVSEAAVIAREDVPGIKRLVAYVVPKRSVKIPSVDALRLHLKERVPEYMVPSALVMLESMPLTPSKKLDRRVLPTPEVVAQSDRQLEAPQGDIEEGLASIWKMLLRVDQVGRRDNFFELGGDSLLIVQMMEQLSSLGLSADVRCVFENPILEELARAVSLESGVRAEESLNLIPPGSKVITPQMVSLVRLEVENIESIVRSTPGGAPNIQDIYPLSPSQEGILFHHLLNEHGGDVYVLPTLLHVCSRARLDDLTSALQQVIDRHDVLRTAVKWDQLPNPVQVVQRRATLPVLETILDPHRAAREQVLEWLRPEFQRIDIRCAPLVQLQVAEDKRNGEWYALLRMHHMTIDHVTLELLITEIVASLDRHPLQLRPVVPYRNHVAVSQAHTRAHDVEAFFRSKLESVGEPTAPFGLLDVRGDGAGIAESHEQIEPTVAERVRMQARRYGVSAATVFHAAWAMVVASTSQLNDVVFGTVLLGRLQGSAGVQRVLGMLTNTLPLRIRLDGATVKELIEQTHQELTALVGHEHASLSVAQRCSGISGDAPLFTALLNYRHSDSSAETQWARAKGIQAIAIQERTNYPITMSVDDFGAGFSLSAQTDQRIDPGRVTAYFHEAVRSLAGALEKAPNSIALALSVLPDTERRQLIGLFNGTRKAVPDRGLVHELFLEQVQRTPWAMAVICDGCSLTYAELDRRSSHLARNLERHGLACESLVGICAGRTPEMLIGLLGILKVGCAYLPLDPDYPNERLRYMLEDANPTIVLIQRILKPVLPVTSVEVAVIEDMLKEPSDQSGECQQPPRLHQSSQSLVYVIYTSGSTGRPKATAMSHRAMVNLIEWHRENLPIVEAQRVLQFAALSFDVAFQEIFTTLSAGGTLVLPDEWVRRDAIGLLDFLVRQSIDRLFVPPVMLQSLAECFRSASVRPGKLKDVITAGEQLIVSPEIVKLFSGLGACKLHNHYGPTETHVVTALTLTGVPGEWPAIPSIGLPIANTQIYILDERKQPVPIGVVGEIHIAGENVARGYLNRPELTAQRFIPNPFGCDVHACMYGTGDLGRWHSDGTIEYMGRNDAQVKIRGHRIELGEIEAQLTRNSQIAKAAVVIRDDLRGERRLVAYVTRASECNPTVEELRAYLKGVLPSYMIPNAFVLLESLPVTSSGKLNRAALPSPDVGAYESRRGDPPKGVVEKAMAQLWEGLLHLTKVSRHDSFFELGGHSLLAVKLLLKVNEALGSSLRVKDLYTHPTIRELAERVVAGAAVNDHVDLLRESILDDDILPVAGQCCTPVRAVLLTGATGFVGRFLLSQLLEDTDATIYCLVRAPTLHQAELRLREALTDWNLWLEKFESRIVAIPGDLRLPRLGIDDATYRILSQEVDSIYHCGTSMNHLETYAMAKSANVESAREILKLAADQKPKLINYISTLGVFNASRGDGAGTIFENSPTDHQVHLNSDGHMASKWVADKIFQIATKRGFPCNIFRLGLMWADSKYGRFDQHQHVYLIIKSCLLSGCGIQNYQFVMPSTPVDCAARAVVHLSNQYAQGGEMFHIAASDQMEDVFERCSEFTGVSLKLVSEFEWICEISRLHLKGRVLPVVPLIEFAFSMDEQRYSRHQGTSRSTANVRFDFTRTRRELARSGIELPILDEDLLARCLHSMLSRDSEIREAIDRSADRLAGTMSDWLQSECAPKRVNL